MENRNADYENVVNGYYDGATELYEWGWGTCFHFSRFYKGESFNQSVCPITTISSSFKAHSSILDRPP